MIWYWQVRRFSKILPAPAIVICVAACGMLFSGCNSRRSDSDLRARIMAAAATQTCHPPEQCYNPHILAYENGYFVTTFAGGKPQYTEVRANALHDYLVALPASVWPRGPAITISPSNDVTDPKAMQRNFERAQKICRDLGLDVQVRMGG